MPPSTKIGRLKSTVFIRARVIVLVPHSASTRPLATVSNRVAASTGTHGSFAEPLPVDRVVQRLANLDIVKWLLVNVNGNVSGIDRLLNLDAILPGRIAGDARPVCSRRWIAH